MRILVENKLRVKLRGHIDDMDYVVAPKYRFSYPATSLSSRKRVKYNFHENGSKFEGGRGEIYTDFDGTNAGLFNTFCYHKFRGISPINEGILIHAGRAFLREALNSTIRHKLTHSSLRGMGTAYPTTVDLLYNTIDLHNPEKIGWRLVADVSGHSFESPVYKTPAEYKKKLLEFKYFVLKHSDRELESYPPPPYTVESLWWDLISDNNNNIIEYEIFMANLYDMYYMGLISDPYEESLMALNQPPPGMGKMKSKLYNMIFHRGLISDQDGPSIRTERLYGFVDGRDKVEFSKTYSFYKDDCGGWADKCLRYKLNIKPPSFSHNAQPNKPILVEEVVNDGFKLEDIFAYIKWIPLEWLIKSTRDAMKSKYLSFNEKAKDSGEALLSVLRPTEECKKILDILEKNKLLDICLDLNKDINNISVIEQVDDILADYTGRL